MSNYDYLSIGVYFLLLLAIGVVFHRLNRDSREYFAGGFKVVWWLLGTSMFITNFSAWTFTGAAHIAYTYGVIIFIIPLSDVLGYLLAYGWFASKFRRLRVVTAMLAVRKRYGRGVEQFYTWLSLLASIVTMTVWIVGLSIVLASVFPVSQTRVITFTGVLVTFLAWYGGRWGLIASDFIQLVLIVGVSISVFLLAVFHLGGFGAFFDRIPEGHWNPILPRSETYDLWWVFGFILMSLVARNNLTTAHRYIAAKDSKHARRAALIPLCGYIILPVVWYLVPMVAEAFSPGLAEAYDHLAIPSEASYVAVAVQLLPDGMLGLLVAAIIASTVSSLGNSLNRNAGYFVKSVYVPLFSKRKMSEHHVLQAGKWATVALSGLVIFTSIYIVQGGKISLFDLYQHLNARLTVPIAVPVFWGLFFSRIPRWGAVATIILGTSVSMLIFGGLDTSWGREILGWFWGPEDVEYIVAHPITWSFLINVPLCSLFCLGSMGFNRRGTEEAKEFFQDLDRPVDFEQEVGGDNTAFQAKALGMFSLIYGSFVALLMFIPNPIEGRVAIGGVAGFLLFLGAILLFYARRTLRQKKDKLSV